MKNKEELIRIGKDIKESKIPNNGKFKSLVMNLSGMKTIDIYETIVELCLQENIECQELINAGSEFRDGELTENDFKNMIYTILL